MPVLMVLLKVNTEYFKVLSTVLGLGRFSFSIKISYFCNSEIFEDFLFVLGYIFETNYPLDSKQMYFSLLILCLL